MVGEMKNSFQQVSFWFLLQTSKFLNITSYEIYLEYQKLIKSHEEFHKLAGNLITAMQLNKEAEVIESHEQFIAMSQKVINYLQILQKNTNKSHDE